MIYHLVRLLHVPMLYDLNIQGMHHIWLNCVALTYGLGQHWNPMVPVWRPYAMATDSVHAPIVEHSNMTTASQSVYLELYNECMTPRDYSH